MPLWLDLGYRLTPSVFVGAFAQYGFGFLGGDLARDCGTLEMQADLAGASANCSTQVIRLGLQGQYTFTPASSDSGWVGAGIGYEWMPVKIGASGGGESLQFSSTARGFEILNLQAGWDGSLSRNLKAGPFVGFSIARFARNGVSCSGDTTVCADLDNLGGSIDDRALHNWLWIGVRIAWIPQWSSGTTPVEESEPRSQPGSWRRKR